MTLNELSLSLGYGGVDFMNGDIVLEGATITESVNGDGGLSLSWKSDVPTCIAAGTECCGFIMMEPYAPSLSSDGIYQHSPKFSDRSALLGKTLFYKTIKIRRGDVEEDIPLYTFSFYGPASEIISALDGCADGFSVGGSGLGEDYIFVSFDGDTVKSAAQKIADACDCEVLYNSSGLTIGHAGNYAGEYYNRFVVLGGTKNLAKATSKGMYAAITQRLTLDPSSYPGSIISTGGSTPMTKMLIFDDIYPKMELKITNVRWRECWLFDENGKKIPDGAGGAYKTYRKYYIKLAYTDDNSQYFLDTRNVIQDRVLGIVFQAGSLAGREFELTYFADSVREYNSDEDLGEGVNTEVGEFRIICQAVNEYLLPSAEFAPTVGQIVTLTNVRLDDHFTDIARAELLSRGQEYAAMYNGGGSLSHSEERVFPDFLTGGGGSTPVVPSGQSVTGVTTDLLTGTQTVQYGTFQPKGKLASMADKIDGVSTGGSGTVAQEEDGYVPAQIGNDNLKVLMEAGCNTGIRTVNTVINNITTELENIGADVTEIQSQADQRMQLWFGTHVPTASNYPANQWLTDAEKQLHVEDVFYNYNREANNPNGGKAWRWTRHETQTEVEGETVTVVTYRWELITDADTLQALEKIADVAYDGKLAGGSEKMRVYLQWQQAIEAHKKYNYLNTEYSLNVDDYNTAFNLLAQMLNGGSTENLANIKDGIVAPDWLDEISTTTSILLSAGFITSLNTEYNWDLPTTEADLEDSSRVAYRKLWEEYYAQADALDKSSKTTANDAVKRVGQIESDGVISKGSEKQLLLVLWRETVASYKSRTDQAADYWTDTTLTNKTAGLTAAMKSLAKMLNGMTGTDAVLANIMDGTTLPAWINAANIGSDTVLSSIKYDANGDYNANGANTLDADTYHGRWNSFYLADSSLASDISDAAKALAQTAENHAQSALALIGDMGNNNKLDANEKQTVKREFLASWEERDAEGGIIDRSKDDQNNYLSQSVATACAAYIAAFKAVGSFLNGRADGQPVEWVGLTITSSTTDAQKEAAMPEWIKTAGMSESNDISGNDWRKVWSGFYTARTAILTALSEDAMNRANAAQETASGAVARLNNIESDGVISKGTEKTMLMLEWKRVVEEKKKLIDQAADYWTGDTLTANTAGLTTAFVDLANMLNGGSTATEDMLNGVTMPLWIGASLNNDITLTITPLAYSNTWKAYYAAVAALLKLIEATAREKTSAAQTDATNALNAIAGIVSDGTLSRNELPDLKREFETAYRQREEMVDLATSDTASNRLIDVSLRTPIDSYLSAFEALANYLNMNGKQGYGTWDEPDGGTYTIYNGAGVTDANAYYIVVAKSQLADEDFPSLLTITSDVKFQANWASPTADGDSGVTFRNLWADLERKRMILANAMTTLAKTNADSAQDKADEAQRMAMNAMNRINAIAYDNLLDEDELEELKGLFEDMIADADSILERTYTPLGVSLDGMATLRTQLINAICTIGSLLNVDPENPENEHSWTFIYDDVSRSVTVNGITTTVFFPEIDKEDTLGANIPYLLDETFEYSEPIAISGTAFLDAWSDYYSIRADLLTAIAKVAERGVYDASDLLSGIADDKRIMQNEKNDLLKQWQAWASEYAVLMAAKNDSTINAGAKWDVYETKLYRLAHFLKDLTDSTTAITVATFEPTMLMTQGITVLTVAQATLYKTVLREFRTARTDLLTALSTGKMNYWVSPFLPKNGFYVGDRCVWKNHLANGAYEYGTDTTMICVKQYDASYVYRQQTRNSETLEYEDSETANAETDNGSNWFDYWKEASTVIGEIVRDPRQQLAALADRLYTLYGSDSTHFPIAVQLTDNGNTVTLNSGSYNIDDAVESCLTQIRDIIGNISFSICLSTPIQPTIQPVHYDMLCVPVTCSIPGNNGESVTGGIQIKMYNGTEWEYIQESTSSLLESLGNKILAMVFGSNAAATEAAGLTVGQRFAKLFAQATVWDASANNGQGDYVTLSQALFGLSISQDINGHYYSSGLLSADKINFTATNSFTTAVGNAAHGLKMVMATEDANTSTFTLGYYYDNNGTQTLKNVLSFDSNGKLVLTGNNVSIGSGFTSLLGITAQSLGITAQSLNIKASDISFVGDDGSTLQFSASNIDFTGYTFSVDAANITLGSGNTPSQGFQNAVAASGVVLKSDMAGIGLYDNSTQTFNAGVIISKEQGGTIQMGKFSSNTLVAGLSFTNDGNGGYVLDLTANTINLNAEDINWNGADAQTPRVVITDSQGNAKFSVDSDGNVTMNDLTANNATLSGVLTSTGRRTSIKIDATDGNATDTAMSMCALVSLNGSTIEKQVLKVGIEDYEYDGEIHTEGVIRLGTTDDNHPGRVAIIKPQKQVIGGNSYTTVIKPGHYYMYYHDVGGASTLIGGETVRFYAYLALMIDRDGVHTYDAASSPERYPWDDSDPDHGRGAFLAAVIESA